MHSRTRRAAAALPLALGLALAAAGDGGRAADVSQPVSGAMVLVRVEPDGLTKYLRQVILDELKAPAPDERAVLKAQATAVLIAAQAQDGRGTRDLWQRAALRDNALKVQKALADNRLDAARKYAAGLYDVGGTAADLRRVNLRDLMQLDEVEMLMRQRRQGGLGYGPPPAAGVVTRDSIEAKLILLARRVPPEAEVAAEADHLVRAAQVTAAMGHLLDAYAPDKKVGPKDPKDWKTWTADMRASAAELEAAARTRDPKRLRAAAVAVTTSCNSCHIVFRD